MSSNSNKSKDLTLLDIIVQINQIFKFLASRWKFIAIFTLSFGLIGLIYTSTLSINYETKSTFFINQGGSENSKILKLVSKLGVGGGSNIINEEQVIQIIKSRKIISSALLHEVELEGESDYLANHFIRLYADELDIKPADFNKLKFVNDSSKHFSFIEDSLMNIIHEEFIENNLIINKTDESIFIIELFTNHELFTKLICESILNTIDQYYLNLQVASQDRMVETLEGKLDSIKKELDTIENEYAKFKDSHISSVKAQAFQDQFELRRQMEVLNVMYVEITKNMEFAKFKSSNENVIEVIDAPVLPLTIRKVSLSEGFLQGSIIGLILSVLILGYMRLREILKKRYAELR